jgi:hypothetical protein
MVQAAAPRLARSGVVAARQSDAANTTTTVTSAARTSHGMFFARGETPLIARACASWLARRAVPGRLQAARTRSTLLPSLPPIPPPPTHTHTHANTRTHARALARAHAHPRPAGIESRLASWSLIPVEYGEGLQVLRYEHGEKYDPHYVSCGPGRAAGASTRLLALWHVHARGVMWRRKTSPATSPQPLDDTRARVRATPATADDRRTFSSTVRAWPTAATATRRSSCT